MAVTHPLQLVRKVGLTGRTIASAPKRALTLRVCAYSKRRAVIGSTLVAFRAGSQTAARATAESRIGVRTKARGSHVFTPNTNPVRNFVSQNAPAMPITRPIAA